MNDLPNDSEWQEIDPSPVVFKAWCGDCPWMHHDEGADMFDGHRCGLLGSMELDWYDGPIAACEATDEALDEWLDRGWILEPDTEVTR